MTLPATTKGTDIEAVEKALIKGDLTELTPQQRVIHYKNTCESLGLNPYTKPFDYLELNGKLVLYPNQSSAAQLRFAKGVSIRVISQDVTENVLTVHVEAKMGDRIDEDVGTVAFIYPATRRVRGQWEKHPKAGQPLENEDRANAVLKAVTKAKRRVTLSICGLGWDERLDAPTNEPAPMIGADVIKQLPVDKPAASTPAEPAAPAAADKAPDGAVPSAVGGTPHDLETGELQDDFGPHHNKMGTTEDLIRMAKAAAEHGSDFFWNRYFYIRTAEEQAAIKAMPALVKELRAVLDKADTELANAQTEQG